MDHQILQVLYENRNSKGAQLCRTVQHCTSYFRFPSASRSSLRTDFRDRPLSRLTCCAGGGRVYGRPIAIISRVWRRHFVCIAASSAQERERKGGRAAAAGLAGAGGVHAHNFIKTQKSLGASARAGGRACGRACGWSEAEQQLAGPLTLIKSQAVAAAAAHCASLDEIDVRSTTFCWTDAACCCSEVSLSLLLAPSGRGGNHSLILSIPHSPIVGSKTGAF